MGQRIEGYGYVCQKESLGAAESMQWDSKEAKGRENCPVRLRTHQREGHGEALRCVSEVEMFGSAYV